MVSVFYCTMNNGQIFTMLHKNVSNLRLDEYGNLCFTSFLGLDYCLKKHKCFWEVLNDDI